MGNHKMSNPFKETIPIYLVVIALLAGALAYYNYKLGIVGIVLLLLMVFYNWNQSRLRAKKWRSYMDEMSSSIDSAARYAVFNLPVPLTVLDLEGRINWYNSKFTDMVGEKSVIGKPIKQWVDAFPMDQIKDGQKISQLKVGGGLYNVYVNVVSLEGSNPSDLVFMLYWFDITELTELTNKLRDERPVMAMINVDNYEDVLNETKEEHIPFVKSEIEKKINLWSTRMNGIIKKYQNDKYIVLFEARYLEHLEAKRFSILDDVREIDVGNKISVTLSIGIGVNGASFMALEEDASAALELALGRGGDQVVLRKKNAYEFYGGKTKAVEKRNRVKARVIAHGFRTLIDESANVIVMGHRSPDMDSFGAAMGVYRSVINRGKEVVVVLNEVTDAIKNVYETFADNEFYRFVDSKTALEMVDDSTLVVVVDTHKPSLTECPELLQETPRIALIDHHRRSTEFIENATLKYLEPYASSTCELVAELIQYMENRPKIEKEEADAMLAGISVDTKNFSLKTGVRTFDAAAYLRRHGADTTRVRQLFQDDLNTFIEKANIVSTAIRHREVVAISTSDVESESIQLIAAQAADDLLNIRGIKASFVIAQKSDGMVFISGRSLGEVNVQVILESLGGGGHLEVAGAQFYDTDIQTVKQRLIESIDEYYTEGEPQ
ncbi:DHH family phosphoesterase [Fusibacter sp. JL298sf-3]